MNRNIFYRISGLLLLGLIFGANSLTFASKASDFLYHAKNAKWVFSARIETEIKTESGQHLLQLTNCENQRGGDQYELYLLKDKPMPQLQPGAHYFLIIEPIDPAQWPLLKKEIPHAPLVKLAHRFDAFIPWDSLKNNPKSYDLDGRGFENVAHFRNLMLHTLNASDIKLKSNQVFPTYYCGEPLPALDQWKSLNDSVKIAPAHNLATIIEHWVSTVNTENQLMLGAATFCTHQNLYLYLPNLQLIGVNNENNSYFILISNGHINTHPFKMKTLTAADQPVEIEMKSSKQSFQFVYHPGNKTMQYSGYESLTIGE